eukprot:augustus_masked-scaffold_10-processed-gene-12.3-mRNA-1 protein AED:1.00 eAED:1.00 QI:0/0/0/0/1/1/2/0/186
MQLMAFVDDIVAFSKKPDQVQDLIFQLRSVKAAIGLRINVKKTRVMKIERSIEVNGEILRDALKMVQERITKYVEKEVEDGQLQAVRQNVTPNPNRTTNSINVSSFETFTHPKIIDYIQDNEEPIGPAEDPSTESKSHPTVLFPPTAITFNSRRITLNSNLWNENTSDSLGFFIAPKIPTSQLERE